MRVLVRMSYEIWSLLFIGFLIPSCLPVPDINKRGRDFGKWTCDDGHFLLVVNGTANCVARYKISYDFLEERSSASAYLKCHPDEFECRISKRCIPRNWVKDGQMDCSWKQGSPTGEEKDTSDEDEFLPTCRDGEFNCDQNQKSRCIPFYKVEDGADDCGDRSDEIQARACPDQTHFRCFNEHCIERWRVNDGSLDCSLLEDENVPFSCIDKLEYACPNNRCIPRKWVGDGRHRCWGLGEDKEVVLSCLEGEFGCLDRTRCLPEEYLCDGIQNCADGSDEVDLCDPPTMYRCADNGMELLPWTFLLRETISALNVHWYCSSEFTVRSELMLGMKCHVMYRDDGNRVVTSGRRRNIPQVYIQNNMTLCSNSEDSCFGDRGRFQCARCLDGTIISPPQLCDGVIDCPDLSDECPCTSSRASELCETVYPKDTDKSAANVSLVCNGTAELDGDLDEKFCDHEVLLFDDVDESLPPDNSNETFFFCKNGDPPYIPASKVRDGRSDCTDRSDECRDGEYSSESEMIGSHTLLSFVWISAFSILGTNIYAIVKQVVEMKKIIKHEQHLWRQSFTFCSAVLLANLAVADMLFGFTLLILGVKAAQYSGRYCEFELDWRSSSTCNFVGVLAVISSQTSMNLLTIIAALRLFVTSTPALQNYLRLRPLWMSSALSWVISACMSLVPIVLNNMITQSHIIGRNPYLDQDVISAAQIETYIAMTNKMATSISSLDHSHTAEWYFNTEEGRDRFPHRNIEIKGTLGYYSSSSICFPDIFSHNRTAMGYSLFMMSYNTLYLLFICVAYYAIYRKVRRMDVPIPGVRQNPHIIRARMKRNASMVTRICYVVAIDIVCWLPITVLTFLSYAGVEPAVDLHPVFVLVIFPLKSFLNPIIYSKLDLLVARRVAMLRAWWQNYSNPAVELEMEDMSTTSAPDEDQITYL